MRRGGYFSCFVIVAGLVLIAVVIGVVVGLPIGIVAEVASIPGKQATQNAVATAAAVQKPQGTYKGTVVDSNNGGTTSSIEFEFYSSDDPTQVRGNCTIHYPLIGGGLFKGTIDSQTNHIEITVTPVEARIQSITFTGTWSPSNKSMNGGYSVKDMPDGGSWSVKQT